MKDTEHQGLGQWVAKIRHDRHMSQEEFAELLDCSARHLSKVENGHGLPGCRVLTGLARSLSREQWEELQHVLRADADPTAGEAEDSGPGAPLRRW